MLPGLSSLLPIENWGLIDYEESMAKQESYVADIFSQKEKGRLIICSHPPTVTRGRKTQAEDIFAWKGPIFDVKRGGRATYHGPSQLVVYPLLNLSYTPSPHPRKDVIWVIRSLEKALIQTLATFNLSAQGKTTEKFLETSKEIKDPHQKRSLVLEDTGVWIQNRKIASIGIGVSRWISYHGIAINLEHDPEAFQGLYPCGYQSHIMTNLEKELEKKLKNKLGNIHQKISRTDFTQLFLSHLLPLIQ
jgi:lipoyl(octanoyl) transferase